jgi:4-hydroxy-tetrahydrodipicolinate synthase
VQKARTVASRRDVDAILTASPYYNKPTQEGQYQHFKAIAEAVDKPLVLYNVPGRTAANIEPATLARLAQIENIIAVKEASGSMTQIAEALNAVPDDFIVLSGDDALTLPIVSIGGRGIISVASNVIPAGLSQMTQAALDDHWQQARKLHHKYLPLMKALFLESNPMPAKCILSMMGRIEENYRLPMVRVTPETRTKLEKIAQEAGLLAGRMAAS